MGKFGWSLPPGCTMNDIERAYGDQPTMLEIYEMQEGGNLDEEQQKIFNQLVEIDCANDLMEKILNWAYGTGYKAHQGDEEEYQYYRSEQRQGRLPKIRDYFKKLRRG